MTARAISPRIVSVDGDVDHYGARAFRERLLKAIGGDGGEVVVDLSRATLVDSTTLGVLLDARKRLVPSGGRLSLVCDDRSILRLLEITALDRLFPIHATLDDAVNRGDGDGTAPQEVANDGNS